VVNGCGGCLDSHEKVLREKNFGGEKILASVRIASVVHALATVLEAGGRRRSRWVSSKATKEDRFLASQANSDG